MFTSPIDTLHVYFSMQHPGGEDIVMEHAGTDATMAFLDKGHSVDAFEMLRDYLIGQLIQVRT